MRVTSEPPNVAMASARTPAPKKGFRHARIVGDGLRLGEPHLTMAMALSVTGVGVLAMSSWVDHAISGKA